MDMSRCALVIICSLILSGLFHSGQAEAFSLSEPEKVGFAVSTGSSYDPQPTLGFAQLSLLAIYDYEQIMPHRAPDQLKFKLEGNFGVADDSRQRAFCSLNFYAHYYPSIFQSPKIKPFVEAGVGVIYSDFQVEGQGLRFNFNPQAGIGAEFDLADRRWFGAVRAHHISNSEFHEDNRGINSIVFQLGFYFD